MTLQINPIGIIHSPHKDKESCPIQSVYSKGSDGELEIFPEFADGLKDIEAFSHIIILYQFDKAGEIKLVRPTFLDDEPHGIFASRHPCRPSGIGFSIVGLENRKKNILKVNGIDVLDKTPLVDIKPYIPKFDCFPFASEGWTEGKKLRPKPEGSE